MENLESVIESVVFVAGEPVLISDLCVKFDVKQKQIEKAVEKLQEKYNENSGVQLLCFNNKLQFASNSDNVDYVTAILNPIRQRNLTKATLETIGIIAYKQPITRSEIEEIRGVGCDIMIRKLIAKALVKEVGRSETVGRPALYAVTDEFMDAFNLKSINELPDLPSLHDEEETTLFDQVD